MKKETGDHAWVVDALPEFLAGRLPEDESVRVEEHLETCPDCRIKANAVSLLQQTPVPSPDPNRWDGFVEGVVTETGRDRTRRRRWLVPGLAVVVVAAAVAGIVWTDRGDGGPDSVTAETRLEVLAEEVAELPAEDVAAWTAGVTPSTVPQLEDSGLTPEELERLVREAGRS